MRALQTTSFETPPKLEDVTLGPLKQGQLTIKIAACGLNFADTLMAIGTYQDTPTPPFTLGMEVCGTVTAHGAGVTQPPIGTRVAVFGGTGGLAEYGNFRADHCRIVPDAMPSDAAAGFIVAYGTSHLALTHRAKLRAGETLLVLGAAGGVGLTAVELGKLMGARVIAVARGPEKLEIARRAGADHLIDSSTQDITAIVKDLGGADVVYDPVGGAGFKAAMRACKPGARMIVIGFASGDVPPVPANIILVKNIDVIGFYWGGYLKFAPEVLGESLSALMDLYVQGKLHPHISNVLPLSQASEALALLTSRKATGKVVVAP